MKQTDALAEILDEYDMATSINGKLNSAHEGYAVILEEVDELWTEVKKKSRERSDEFLKREAVQIAAMALRFLVDIIP